MQSVPNRQKSPELAARARRTVLALPLLLAVPAAHAASLGGYEVQSSLGQPLRMVVQITARPGETIEAGCFRLNPFTVANDGLPQLTGAVLLFDKRGSEPRLTITSARPILDPIVRVSIDVGCDTTLRRDLTILLDPAPVIETQAQTTEPAKAAGTPTTPVARPAAAASADGSAQSAPAGTAGQSDARASSGAGAAAAQAGTAAPSARAPAARRTARPDSIAGASKSPVAPAPPRAPKAASSQAGPAPAKAPAQPPRDRLTISASGPPLESYVSAPITPRLTLSTSLTDRTGQPPLPESVLSIVRQKQARLKAAPPEEDIPSLEAELVVLQKRTAEMRSQLDAVMAQMKSMRDASGTAAAGSAPAAAAAAPEATPVSSLPEPAPTAHWNWSDPRLLLVVFLALFLALGITFFAFWLRRERSDSRRATRWNKTPYVPVTAPAAPRPPQPASRSMFGTNPEIERLERAAGRADRPPMPDSYAFTPFSTGQAAHELGVSDLAQATEKASVFVTLGRPEQAIDVLRDHIDHESKPSPMAWLMLQDLYRKTDRRSEFEEVAKRFHLEFNAEAPSWDPASQSPDQGLSGFPRLIRRIRENWGTAEARAYIEELLYDNKAGSRVGFSLPAFRDLLLLYSIIDAHLLALEAPERIDPRTGTIIPPSPPPLPPPHLAKAWAEAANPAPDHPGQSSLQLDMGQLSDSPECSALEAGYPIIAKAITTRWGKPGVAEYLSNLIRATDDNRGPNLSDEIMAELIMLHDVALELGEPEPNFSIE